MSTSRQPRGARAADNPLRERFERSADQGDQREGLLVPIDQIPADQRWLAECVKAGIAEGMKGVGVVVASEVRKELEPIKHGQTEQAAELKELRENYGALKQEVQDLKDREGRWQGGGRRRPRQPSAADRDADLAEFLPYNKVTKQLADYKIKVRDASKQNVDDLLDDFVGHVPASCVMRAKYAGGGTLKAEYEGKHGQRIPKLPFGSRGYALGLSELLAFRRRKWGEREAAGQGAGTAGGVGAAQAAGATQGAAVAENNHGEEQSANH